jgi:polysaccharide pyruvyl transferase WcaK-like protein
MMTDTQKKVAILNHTDLQGHHFGCSRVMRLLEQGLTSRSCEIIGRLDGKLDWRTDQSCLEILGEADAIVINGEGTLHHGRKKASWLMSVASHPVTQHKELAIVNTLYQDNPSHWIPLVRGFSHLYARDNRSAKHLGDHAGRPVPFFGDLSTSEIDPRAHTKQHRDLVTISDSVNRKVSDKLSRLAQDLESSTAVSLTPLTRTLREENPYSAWPVRTWRKKTLQTRQLLRERRFPLLKFVNSESEFLDKLLTSKLCITGRFHGVCLCLATNTPFIAISSNSWKIEALFEDAGISWRRLVKINDLNRKVIEEKDWHFSEEEKQKISHFLARSHAGAAGMFEAIAS